MPPNRINAQLEWCYSASPARSIKLRSKYRLKFEIHIKRDEIFKKPRRTKTEQLVMFWIQTSSIARWQLVKCKSHANRLQANKLINFCLSTTENLNHYNWFLLKSPYLRQYTISNHKSHKRYNGQFISFQMHKMREDSILTNEIMDMLKAAAFLAAVWQLHPGPMKACTPELIWFNCSWTAISSLHSVSFHTNVTL